MEYKKKKNESKEAHDQRRFIVIMCLLILVLLFGLGLLTYTVFSASAPSPFDRTATTIVSTNEPMVLRIWQTDEAITEQFMLTGTALP